MKLAPGTFSMSLSRKAKKSETVNRFGFKHEFPFMHDQHSKVEKQSQTVKTIAVP